MKRNRRKEDKHERKKEIICKGVSESVAGY